jgi:hypothetical protein
MTAQHHGRRPGCGRNASSLSRSPRRGAEPDSFPVRYGPGIAVPPPGNQVQARRPHEDRALRTGMGDLSAVSDASA